MFFTKFPHPANCSFLDSYDPQTGVALSGTTEFAFEIQPFEGGIHRLRIRGDRWVQPRPVVELLEPSEVIHGALVVDRDARITVSDSEGVVFLRTAAGTGFGVSGGTWMFCFEMSADARFFGMGEKLFGRMELSGLRTKFWNTDVWSDFHWAQWGEHASDPPYLSVPYVIVRDGDEYTGILVNSGYPAFFETPGTDKQRVFVEWQRTSPHLLVGSEGGQPEIWIIRGPDLRSLTRKLQKLVGVTPTPPLWALGYHQSRWGYAGEKDLNGLNRQFKKHDIPCDGLWLDIDYMEGYRVFTVDDSHFPKGVETCFSSLLKDNRRVVAILDPGVKSEKGFTVYDEGHRAGHFCLNREGHEFIGLVWPGETVFPDFTLSAVRDWWAGRVAGMCDRGFGGFWLDMNDPSTGPVDPSGMLFDKGREPHEAHRNSYALGMQRASFEGMLKSRPDERPFLLSRSGCQGTSRYSAVWTGDNLSNYAYLKQAIPTSVNLSLSGIPFNGPDIGGFGGDSNEALMVDWIRTCFLFPFARNHTGLGTRDQEPWAYSAKAEETIARYIRLRYQMLPYLCNLFCDQEELGDPILRPLAYEFAGHFDDIDDQFMVGPSILQAPVVEPRQKVRKFVLPGAEPWFEAATGEWIQPGRRSRKPELDETPLYIRNGSILPMQSTPARPVDLRHVDLHVFAAPGTSGRARTVYRADDGLTYGYRRGERTVIEIHSEWDAETIGIRFEECESGFGKVDCRLILHAGVRKCLVNGKELPDRKHEVTLTGRPLHARKIKT